MRISDWSSDVCSSDLLDSDRRDDEDPFGLEFEVESYLEAHARRFVRNFDRNCYLYRNSSMDWYDFGDACGGTTDQTLARIRVDMVLALGTHHDTLVPLPLPQQVADGMRRGGARQHLLQLAVPPRQQHLPGPGAEPGGEGVGDWRAPRHPVPAAAAAAGRRRPARRRRAIGRPAARVAAGPRRVPGRFRPLRPRRRRFPGINRVSRVRCHEPQVALEWPR